MESVTTVAAPPTPAVDPLLTAVSTDFVAVARSHLISRGSSTLHFAACAADSSFTAADYGNTLAATLAGLGVAKPRGCVQLVFASVSGSAAFLPELLALAGVPFGVAFDGPTSDADRIVFATNFYRQLALSVDVCDAFRVASLAVDVRRANVGSTSPAPKPVLLRHVLYSDTLEAFVPDGKAASLRRAGAAAGCGAGAAAGDDAASVDAAAAAAPTSWVIPAAAPALDKRLEFCARDDATLHSPADISNALALQMRLQNVFRRQLSDDDVTNVRRALHQCHISNYADLWHSPPTADVLEAHMHALGCPPPAAMRTLYDLWLVTRGKQRHTTNLPTHTGTDGTAASVLTSVSFRERATKPVGAAPVATSSSHGAVKSPAPMADSPGHSTPVV